MADEVRYVRLDPNNHQAAREARKIIEEEFLRDETVCQAVGVVSSPQAVQDLSELVAVMLQDGLSVAAYIGDLMVGVSVNKLQERPPAGEKGFFERFRDDHVKDPRARFVMDFMIQVDSMADLFAELSATHVLEVTFLGVVANSGRGKGIGRDLVAHSIQLARGLPVRPQGITAIFTSDISHAIGRRLGFKEVAVAENSTFLFNDQPIGDRLGPLQKRSILAALQL